MFGSNPRMCEVGQGSRDFPEHKDVSSFLRTNVRCVTLRNLYGNNYSRFVNRGKVHATKGPFPVRETTDNAYDNVDDKMFFVF